MVGRAYRQYRQPSVHVFIGATERGIAPRNTCLLFKSLCLGYTGGVQGVSLLQPPAGTGGFFCLATVIHGLLATEQLAVLRAAAATRDTPAVLGPGQRPGGPGLRALAG